jgi:hypothetical protein
MPRACLMQPLNGFKKTSPGDEKPGKYCNRDGE